MPRLARLDAPGVLHHIIIRGIERKNIFNDDKDRDNFLEQLSVLLPETKTSRYILSKSRQREKVDARSLFCYWVVRELGMSLTELARYFGMSPSAVSYAVERGEIIATDNNYQLIN